MQALAGPAMWPLSPVDRLKQEYLGKDLHDIPAPAAILDVAVLRKNCELMLHTADVLSVGFRAHVKTHKTTELTRLQVGVAPRSVKVIVSTVSEAEHLLPFLIECKRQSRGISLLYGIPPSSTCFARLQPLRDALGSTSLCFLIDHPAQLQNFKNVNPSDPIPVLIKTDTGYHRAGLPPSSQPFKELLRVISSCSHVTLHGFYSHNSNSYGSNSPSEALAYLSQELSCIASAADIATRMPAFIGSRFTLSVGATPTTTAAQNLLSSTSGSEEIAKAKNLIERIQESHDVELHAGVYTTLDLQQLAAHARPHSNGTSSSNVTKNDTPTLQADSIGLRILAEVLSVYPTRGPVPEALVSAGSLALAREPCKAYPGWAVVAPDPWGSSFPTTTTSENDVHVASARPVYDITRPENERQGWIVGKVSQEHGILSWQGNEGGGQDGEGIAYSPLEVGQKITLWPNHACMAAAQFGWYLVVDSDESGVSAGSRVVDVWARWRGW